MAPKSVLCAFLIGAAATVFAAPMPQAGVDSPVLLQNAQEAQRLNTAFQSLTKDDPCQDDEASCIDGEGAICINGRWSIQERCSRRETCFALPLLDSTGTAVTCASQRDAVAVFQQAGVDSPFNDGDAGAITPPPANIGSPDGNNITSPGEDEGQGRNGQTDALPSPNPTEANPTEISTRPPNVITTTKDLFSTTLTQSSLPQSSSPLTPSVTDAPAATQTITQFIPVPISEGSATTITLAPETRTISPEEASSILSSIASATVTTSSSSCTTDLFSTVTTIPIFTTGTESTVVSLPTIITTSAPGASDSVDPSVPQSSVLETGSASDAAGGAPTPILTLTPAPRTPSA